MNHSIGRFARVACLLIVFMAGVATIVGSGGGGGGGSTDAPTAPGAPQIITQPQGTLRIVGQAFTTAVTVSSPTSTPTFVWESSADGNAPWTPVADSTSATLTVPAVAIGDHEKRFRVRVTNAAGTATSNPAVLTVAWGSVNPSADLSSLEEVYGEGGSDGGSPGGGDGAGADGGVGLGKALNARIRVTRVADGALIGSALTDANTGLVKIKAGPGAAPLLIALQGAEGATYYDEGRNAAVPFPDTYVLHALVDRIDENLGVTPLTEAAYRYAINNFVDNPTLIASGARPLLRTADVSSLTAAQIRQANDIVRNEINRLLPSRLQLESVKSLPTPVDAGSPNNALKASRYGLAAVVTGGIVRNAYNYLPSATAPGLEVTEQLARDLTDGRLDGFALDGTPAATAGAVYYDAARPAVEIDSAGSSVSRQFGLNTTLALAPEVGDVTVGSTYPDGDITFGCQSRVDNIALTKSGVLNVRRMDPPAGQTCAAAQESRLLEAFATGIRFVRSVERQAFVVGNNGSVRAWGDAVCGLLGEGSTSGRQSAPVLVDGITDITSLATGNFFAIARDKAGQVYTWGADAYSALGLGDAPAYDEPSCDVLSGALDGGGVSYGTNTRPRRVESLSDITVVAADQLAAYAVDVRGDVFQWGLVATESSPEVVLSVPTRVNGLSRVSSVVTSGGIAFALRSDGSVWGFGRNNLGNFGDGSSTPKQTPAKLEALSDVVQIAGDAIGGAAALLRDGTVRVWDWSLYRQPTTPTVNICVVANSLSSTCLRTSTGPFPKMRHVAGNGFAITMVGLDGTVYLRSPGTNQLRVIEQSSLVSR